MYSPKQPPRHGGDDRGRLGAGRRAAAADIELSYSYVYIHIHISR